MAGARRSWIAVQTATDVVIKFTGQGLSDRCPVGDGDSIVTGQTILRRGAKMSNPGHQSANTRRSFWFTTASGACQSLPVRRVAGSRPDLGLIKWFRRQTYSGYWRYGSRTANRAPRNDARSGSVPAKQPSNAFLNAAARQRRIRAKEERPPVHQQHIFISLLRRVSRRTVDHRGQCGVSFSTVPSLCDGLHT